MTLTDALAAALDRKIGHALTVAESKDREADIAFGLGRMAGLQEAKDTLATDPVFREALTASIADGIYGAEDAAGWELNVDEDVLAAAIVNRMLPDTSGAGPRR